MQEMVVGALLLLLLSTTASFREFHSSHFESGPLPSHLFNREHSLIVRMQAFLPTFLPLGLLLSSSRRLLPASGARVHASVPGCHLRTPLPLAEETWK